MTAASARGRRRPLGHRQTAILVEAASEVTRACPWVTIDGDRRTVESLVARGLAASTQDLFAIMPAGCMAIRRTDPQLAREALIGLRRNMREGAIMPWDV
jgi:hypothetical protein